MSFENTFEYFGGIDRLDTLRQIVPQVSCCRLKKSDPHKNKSLPDGDIKMDFELDRRFLAGVYNRMSS